MEEQGLWKDSEIQGPIIYKVTEFYDWHTWDRDIVTTIFWGKEIAESYISKRMMEIPDEMFDGRSLDEIFFLNSTLILYVSSDSAANK